jgi:hypothetical protein
MKDLTQIWQQAQHRAQRERYGYTVTRLSSTASQPVAPAQIAPPVVRPAASVADILGFNPRRRCGLHSPPLSHA